jgi:hypothetical protein
MDYSQPVVEAHKKAILQELKQFDQLSFAQISQLPLCAGEDALSADDDINLVLWVHLAFETVVALKQLLIEDILDVKTTTPLVYHMDGQTLDFPLAKKIELGHYKEPHWVPVIFSKGPKWNGNNIF